jgi:SAM-dependent methyltransferase
VWDCHLGNEPDTPAVGKPNVVTVLGDQQSTNLARGSVDLALVCDVYHHFEYPEKSLASIREALEPTGHLVIVDFELNSAGNDPRKRTVGSARRRGPETAP